MKKEIQESVSDYYTQKILESGATPHGVDWNGKDSQFLRFEQLCRIINPTGPFSINDIGCGYGALLAYLNEHYSSSPHTYYGNDISNAMIEAAKTENNTNHNAHFEVSLAPSQVTDYCIASGIYNVKMNYGNEEWLQYILKSLDMLHANSSCGFSFNCLTSFSDSDKMRPHLYYADPAFIFNHCKNNYSRNVALLHDYNLYEFTILVRK